MNDNPITVFDGIESPPLPNEFDGLPTFAVGGWVRDHLRGETPSDVDLMVAEVSPDEMRERGFTEVDNSGNDTFGVFVDSLGREVAIAREEASTGGGHRDFDVTPVPADVHANKAVKRDLKRRDFTINALALDLRWRVLHDPHDGVQDLEDEVLRHVTDAFKQDPLRILRGARFAARLDFEIDGATFGAMMDGRGRLRDLPQERVRMEMEKAFKQGETPRTFFDVLNSVGALAVTFPEIAALVGVPAGPPEHHQEGDTFEHTMMAVEEMHELRPNDELALLMALAHDLGKGHTPSDELPSHPAHGSRGVAVVSTMVERLSMSNAQENAMKDAARFHMRLHDIDELRHATVLKTFERLSHPERMIDLVVADAHSHEPARTADHTRITERFMQAEAALDSISGEDLIEEGYDPEEMGGKEFGDLLHQRRVEHMRALDE